MGKYTKLKFIGARRGRENEDDCVSFEKNVPSVTVSRFYKILG